MLVSGRLTVIGSVVPLTKHSRNLLPPTAPTAQTARPAARPPNPKCHHRLLSPTRRRRGSGTAITNNVDSDEDVGKVIAAVALFYNHQSLYPCSSNSLILPLHLFSAISCSGSGNADISVSPHSICELVDGLAASSRNKSDINACNLFEGHWEWKFACQSSITASRVLTRLKDLWFRRAAFDMCLTGFNVYSACDSGTVWVVWLLALCLSLYLYL